MKQKSNQSESNHDSTKKSIYKKKFNWKKLIKAVLILTVFVGITIFVYNRYVGVRLTSAKDVETIQTAKVETRDIQTVLSSSGTIQPLHTYDVTTLVEGEVISADFEEGDQVEKGDVLYKVTTDDIDSKIASAETDVTRAEEDYDKMIKTYNEKVEKYQEALEDYNDAARNANNLKIESTASGIITKLFVKEGDSVQNGAQIAEVYNNSYMLLVIPFNSSDVEDSLIGKKATVQVTGSNETISGVVSKVSNLEETLSGNRLVKKVTIKVKNPGGITTSNTATASIGSLDSSSEGSFNVYEDTIITADQSGKIATLKVTEGDSIKEGGTILVFDGDSVSSQLDSYTTALDNAEDARDNAKDSVEQAKETIEDKKSALQDEIDSKTDYSIKAPISGQVVTKNTLIDDTISAQEKTTLCTIYDLSSVTFEMNIDELDIKSVKVGQEVNVTADALEGVEIKGVVTNISLVSSSSNGVTQYPVTVQIDDVCDLLPGMNVTGEIITEEATGVLAVPTDALQRGDVVYVKDDSVTEANGSVPAGFKAVEVKTGLSDGDYIEITSGLTGNEEVYLTRKTDSGTIIMQNAFGNGMGNMKGNGFGNGSGFGMPGGNGSMPSSRSGGMGN